MMRRKDRPEEKHDMHHSDSYRDRSARFLLNVTRRFQMREFLPEAQVVNHVCGHDSQDGPPAEVGEHITHVPTPFCRDHDYRRCREMGQSSPNGNIHKQKSQGRISEWLAWFKRVEFLPQKERANCHRGGLRDSRTE